MKVDFKFLGLLKEVNFDLLDEELLSVLINNKIYFEDFAGYEIKPVNSESLDKVIYFNGNAYKINDDLHDEIYHLLKLQIEHQTDVNFDLESIKHKLNSFLSNDKKVKYLNKKYSKIYQEDLQHYSIYIGQGTNGIKDWKEWTFYSIASSHSLLSTYLTFERTSDLSSFEKDEAELINLLDDYIVFNSAINKNKELLKKDGFFEFMNTWKMLYSIDHQLNFIKSEIDKLENKPNLKDKEPKSLKDLFANHDKYENIIKTLKSKNLIGADLKIIYHGEKGIKPLMIKACIGYLLREKGYLITRENGGKLYNTTMCEALNNTFNGESLSPSLFSSHCKLFTRASAASYFKNDYLHTLSFI